MVRSRGSTWEEISASAVFMLKWFVPYTVIILLMLIFIGREFKSSQGTILRLDILLFTYPLGALVTGGLLGWFEGRFTTSRIMALVYGFVALLPWIAGISLAFDNGHQHWTRSHTFMTLIMSAWVGFWLRPQVWPKSGAA
jgi:hypothetical protein